MVRVVLLQVVFPILFVLSLFTISYNSSHIISPLNLTELTHTNLLAINKTSLFLFFNAILLFIARDSGLLLAPSSAPATAAKGGGGGGMRPVKAIVAEEKAEVEADVEPCLELVVVEEEISDQELEEEEELDELNRRCEEFIEKIKRERLTEAKQLVMWPNSYTGSSCLVACK